MHLFPHLYGRQLLFVCVEVLWPSQPNGVMSSVFPFREDHFSEGSKIYFDRVVSFESVPITVKFRKDPQKGWKLIT